MMYLLTAIGLTPVGGSTVYYTILERRIFWYGKNLSTDT